MSEIKKKRTGESATSVTKPTSSKETTLQPDTAAKKSVIVGKNTDDLDPHTKRILKIRELMKLRDQARTNGEFGKSDSIRDHLVEKYNVDIIDQKDGPSGWKFKDGSSNKISSGAKLPAKASDATSSASKKRGRDEDTTQPAATQGKKAKNESATIMTKPKGKRLDFNHGILVYPYNHCIS